jgi:kynureninase
MSATYTFAEDTIYLLSHSLGPPSIATLQAARACSEHQWARGLAASWNDAGWFEAPQRLGAKIAPMIGARAHEVIVCDSVSVNIYKLAVAALQARQQRPKVLIEAGGFPTDHYVLEGACVVSGANHMQTAPRETLGDFIDETTALVVVSHVDFRSGHRHDIEALTRTAQAAGAWILWDLSHSLAAVEITVGEADFAVGCGYKYVCGGPGAPGFLFIAERHQGRLRNPVSGWFGHAAPFAFEPAYRAADAASAFAAGTPPILSITALEQAIDDLGQHDLQTLSTKAHHLGEVFDQALRAAEFGLTRITPPSRGAHLAYTHPHAQGLCQALIGAGVICDFRAPDVIRFGFNALFLTDADALHAAGRVQGILSAADFMRTILAGGVVT